MRAAVLLLLMVFSLGILAPHFVVLFSFDAPAKPVLEALDFCHGPDSTLSAPDSALFLHPHFCQEKPYSGAELSDSSRFPLHLPLIPRLNDRPPKAQSLFGSLIA